MRLRKLYPVFLRDIIVCFFLDLLILNFNGIYDLCLCLISNVSGKIIDLNVIRDMYSVFTVVTKCKRPPLVAAVLPDNIIPTDSRMRRCFVIISIVVVYRYGFIRIILGIGRKIPAKLILHNNTVAVYDLIPIILNMVPEACSLFVPFVFFNIL